MEYPPSIALIMVFNLSAIATFLVVVKGIERTEHARHAPQASIRTRMNGNRIIAILAHLVTISPKQASLLASNAQLDSTCRALGQVRVLNVSFRFYKRAMFLDFCFDFVFPLI